jgi:hypothetical protein
MSNDHDQFAAALLAQAVPTAVSAVALPRRRAFHGSPVDWRDEVLYFLLVDRFSDGLGARSSGRARRASVALVDRRRSRRTSAFLGSVRSAQRARTVSTQLFRPMVPSPLSSRSARDSPCCCGERSARG